MCGASQGIGAASARELSELGARVVLVSRSFDKLEEVRKSLKDPQNHLSVALDLSDYQSLPKILDEKLKNFKEVTILVNNSGGPPSGALTEVSPSEFEKAIRSHVSAAQTLTQYFLPQMKALKYGRIINVISTSVKIPIANLGLSNTIRGAMASWAKSMANELGPFGITVNNVLPGYTLTPRLEALAQAQSGKQNISVDDVKENWKTSIPLRRFAEAKELGEVIAFLATEASGYISGINVPVDGGRTGCL